MIVLLFISPGHTEELKPFVSDGCSLFPDGTQVAADLWLSCCVDHDRTYWQGGTKEERVTADMMLQECVERVSEPEIAAKMKVGVRFGGTPFLPLPFRWGYGWPYPRGYKALSDLERKMVIRRLAEDEGGVSE